MCIYDNGSQAKNVSTSENFLGCIACRNCPLVALNVATTDGESRIAETKNLQTWSPFPVIHLFHL